MKRLVTWPELLRPPVFRLPIVSDFSGLAFVMSFRSSTEVNRRVGVVGRYDLTGILELRVLRHFLASLEANVCLFPVRTISGELAATAQLAEIVDGVNVGNLHLEELLNRGLDLGLGGFR